MPKISAPTVKEHRQAVLGKLVDAAETLLRTEGPGSLTAGAVTARAGIARNSIYRYVDSVDDLSGLVLARYLPRWMRAVDACLEPLDDPRERVREWVRANLEQAAVNGHGWLMQVARSTRLEHGLKTDLDHAHSTGDFLTQSMQALEVSHLPIRAELIRSVVDAGFRCLDAGEPLADVTRWALVAVDALLDQTAETQPTG